MHEFTKYKSINIDEILNGKLILREKGSWTREIFENKVIEMGYALKDFKPYMELGSITAIKSLVEANLGYSIISKETVKKELESGKLK
jgi:LysR family transcriptional regulator, transcriptional activator of the cysJI operon